MLALNKLSLNNLRGDLLGGLTAAIVSLPLALTFGVASGAGAEAGLYGAILIGLFASLFGGTSTLISEPTGPMTVVMTAVVSSLIASNPDKGMAMAFTVVMMAGAFQIFFGYLKLGKYITLMPYSVVSGFMSGIGVILILLQLAPALGQSAPAGGVIGTISHIPELLSNIRLPELMLFSMTLVVLFLTPAKYKKYIPPQLIALVFITLLSVLFFSNGGINRIGEIDVSLPSMVMPYFTQEELRMMLIDAMVLGMLGCIDSMLTSVIADNLTRTEHNSNKELVGQGLGNIMSGLFGGLPGAGATMGTVVNIQSGGRTALSGVFRVAVLVVAVFGAASLIETIPLAVLAAIAVKVGVDILDWSFIKRAHRVSRHSTLIMYAVLLLTVFVDLIVAVGVGVFIANVIIIEKLSAVEAQKIKAMSDVDDEIPLNDEQRELLNSAQGRLLFFYLSGAMIFGVSKALARERKNIESHDAVIFDISHVSLLDDTMTLSLENVILEAVDMGKHVTIVVRTDEAKAKLMQVGLEAHLSDEHFTNSRTKALERSTQFLNSY
ncbi:SulP family inorganic anion transporter [Alteromonas sp. LMIT006]|jgi:SulP family sulfate permease|uniref:SulP family inorganic anion transporter n=1 Tax=Alteromonadaceae TaxID=72275 RepID=UPI0020CA97F4|nr:SulP family inorganic anion transporter [Alteromonas sp. LMIT006]UTP72245.1 SulP family inorganic anion transporter [Alteromonas sp. LMIT006]